MNTRKILNYFYTAYAFAIVALLAVPRDWMPEFYRPLFMAGISTVAAMAVAAPGWIFKTKDEHKKKVLERSQLVIAFAMLINGLGGLGLYKLYQFGIEYDKILHFIIPTLMTIVIAYFLIHWYDKPLRFATTFAVIAVLVGGIGWEAWEVTQDKIFGTQTAGVYGEDYVRDTTLDIFADIGGTVLGAYLILRHSKNKVTNLDKVSS